MKLSILSLLIGSAAAFAPSTSNSGSNVVAKAAIDDLEAIAAKSNPVLKVCETGAMAMLQDPLHLDHGVEQ